MKDEYIIINKTAIQKRIEGLRQVCNKELGYASDKIYFELEHLLSQSTPLVTEIEKSQNEICDIFLKPIEQLKPLEDLWRKENSLDKFIAPDTTQFFIWIREKILNANK